MERRFRAMNEPTTHKSASFSRAWAGSSVSQTKADSSE